MEASWRISKKDIKALKMNTASDWKNSVNEYQSIIKVFEDVANYPMSIHKLYAALVSGKISNVDELYQEASDFAFLEWNRLPAIISRPHVKWLQEFHKLIELKESKKLLESEQKSEHNLELFKTISSAWRERLPNTWERITIWSDILQWRVKLYETLSRIQRTKTMMQH